MEKVEQQNQNISKEDRKGLYKTIFSRRDVHTQFLDTAIPDEVLSRILYAAHYAPSAGFMQPWDFLLIRNSETRQKVHAAFAQAHAEAATMFSGEKQNARSNFKLKGILDCALNICVTCDTTRTSSVVFNRHPANTMDTSSSICTIQNLWLAARAEGLGVGWVSIIDEETLKEILEIPDHVIPVGYLCVGYVSHFLKKPELENDGWLPRLDIRNLISFDRWHGQPERSEAGILQQLKQDADFPAAAQEGE
ncbi:5,6-dimethylbenzimidazole synthase [Desulforhopalus vacuolatus]|uniref:5,6-dimethylbenzimidazole synthase n=1 Tax=Desulforhopalus vacuolatus TaxID=40414 RepID=UPI0019632169|nr:5,6-dimethylbenzimidazole synthase [Desulforhopalus vacuolatus]MBM9518781.1 5,6-dimethylbenzimidazole synthase [Desulforhopalus vacuolatus]